MDKYDQEVSRLVAQARSITSSAEAQGRALRPGERSLVEGLIEQTNELKRRQSIERATIGGSRPSIPERGYGRTLWDAVKSAGIEPQPGQIARHVLAQTATHVKDLIAAGSEDVLERNEQGIEREPILARYAYNLFGTVDIDPYTNKVTYVRQSARILADPDEAAMPFASVEEKPETTSEVELVSDDPKQFATVTPYFQNAYVAREELRSLVQDDMALALRESLDKHVTDELTAAATATNADGADLIEKIVYAQAAVRDNGFNPNVTLLSSADATGLLLARSNGPEEMFLLGNRPDLGTLRVCSGVLDGQPIVLDTSAAGKLYMGQLTFDVDALTGFTTNQTRYRLEHPGLFVARRGDAIAVVDSLTSS